MLAQLQHQRKSPESARDSSGLMDEEAYTSEARSWSSTPPSVADGGQNMVAGFAGVGGRVTSYRGN